MYEYSFRKIEVKKWTVGVKEDYYHIIDDYASQGWRLVQIFAPPLVSRGAPFYELIFERKLENHDE